MKRIDIRDKLKEIDCPVETIVLGDFDFIGEYTAKKNRNRESDLYKRVGCFFRPNYERGILIHNLIKRFEMKSFLEVGFGRGYVSFCAAKAMCDSGSDGVVHSVDPNFNEELLKQLTKVFPREWFERLNLMKGTLSDALPDLEGKNFDMIYIDGDHRYDAVKSDWENVRGRYDKFLLFDDYTEEEDVKDIEVNRLIDEIDDELTKAGAEAELIISDRRIFFDDRRIPDEEVNYGQVLVRNPDFDVSDYIMEW